MRFRLILSSMSATAFAASPNAFFNISEVNKASDFKIQNNIAIDRLYIFTGNDATSYFRSAENRIHVSIFVMFGSQFLDNGSTDSESVYSFENNYSRASFPLL